MHNKSFTGIIFVYIQRCQSIIQKKTKKQQQPVTRKTDGIFVLWPLAGAVSNKQICASLVSVNASWRLTKEKPLRIVPWAPHSRGIKALALSLASWLFSFTFKWKTLERDGDWTVRLSITHDGAEPSVRRHRRGNQQQRDSRRGDRQTEAWSRNGL